MSELLGARNPFPGLQVVQHTIGLKIRLISPSYIVCPFTQHYVYRSGRTRQFDIPSAICAQSHMIYKARFFDSTVDTPAPKCSSDWGNGCLSSVEALLHPCASTQYRRFLKVESLRGKIERFANITQRAYYQCGTPADPKLAIVHKFDRLIEVGNEVLR